MLAGGWGCIDGVAMPGRGVEADATTCSKAVLTGRWRRLLGGL